MNEKMTMRNEEKIRYLERLILSYENYEKERKLLIKKILESESSKATSLEELLIELKKQENELN
jgi:hypothetical protein